MQVIDPGNQGVLPHPRNYKLEMFLYVPLSDPIIASTI
jgi:hypothetical protein